MVAFETGMTVSQKLGEYDKESLKEYGTGLGLTGLSSLKKADLVDKIAQQLLNSEVLFHRMAILTKEEISLLQKGINVVYLLQEDELDEAEMLNEMNLVALAGKEMITIADLYAVYQSFEQDTFEEYRKKVSWVRKCLFWAEELYVFTPNDVMLDLVNCKKGLHMKQDELSAIIKQYPKDELSSVPFNEFFLNKVYMQKERIPELDQLQQAQSNKDYYFPTEAELEEFFQVGALIREKAYQDLQAFIQKEFGIEEAKARNLMIELWQKEAEGVDPHIATKWFWEQFSFDDDATKQKIVELFMHVSGATRSRVNRGFKSVEMLTQGGFAGALVNGAGSLNPGNIPQVNMGNGQKSGTVYAEKKIYPNDPCPCGSGKKYKKCCGKNK